MKCILSCPKCSRQILLAEGKVSIEADIIVFHCPTCGTLVRVDYPHVAKRNRAFYADWKPAKKEDSPSVKGESEA